MFCLSCGKKIPNNSKFCKYCGQKQTKSETNITKEESESIWECDYCGQEFKTKKESDTHELKCVKNYKNKKFLFNTNPKRAWVLLWLTTILVFVISIFLCIKFADVNVPLLSGEVLLIMFLGNIFIGIFSFFALAFSKTESKNNRPKKFVRYIFTICLSYLIINSSVFAVEGYRAKKDEVYRNKYYNNQISNPAPTLTPLSPDFKNELLKEISDYRLSQKLSALSSDDDVCKIAEKLIKKGDLNEELKESDYIDVCPKCNGIGLVWVERISSSNVLVKLKESKKTKDIIDDKNYRLGCTAVNNQRIIFVLSSKTSQSSSPKTTTQNYIDCIGPDNKQFKTTYEECKKLNETWGKPIDYMTNCEISSNCGGGTKYIKYSDCTKSVCCQIGSNWILYSSEEKCDSDQKKNSSTNSNPPPAANTQNTSPKVAFQATETSIKGTYYCYENKVNEMVTQQALVKGQRELYETCKNSSYNQSVFNKCWSDTCGGLPDTSSCSQICYDKAYGNCSEYYKTYSSYRSKLDSMRWSNCP